METTNEEKRPALYKYVNIPAGERFNPDRPSFETACGGSRTQGSVLNYLVSKACYIAELQKLQSYKVIHISVDRTEVLKTLRISEQTYIACLKALNAFKYIDSKRYTRGEYDINLETINEGIEHPPERRRRGRPKGSTKKSESNKSEENALTLEESPLTYAQELEEKVKALTGELKVLELKVISILTFQQVLELKLKELELSHSHEPAPEAERWAFFTPLDYLDSNEITIEEESEGEQTDTATIAPSLSFGAALSLSEIENESQQGDTLDADTLPGSSDRAGTPPAVGDSLPPEQDLQSLPSTPGPILQAESAPEIDLDFLNAETEPYLPAIPKTPSLSPAVEPGRSGGPTPVAPAPLPGLTSHEQNRGATSGSVTVEADSGCTTPAPARPVVPPGVTPPKTIRATVVSPPPQVLVVSQQFTSVEDWEQAQKAFVERLRGIWKTTTPDFKRQVGNWNGYRKQYLDRWLKANPDPTNVQFTDDGKTLFDEWCSLFKARVDAGKANIEAANWLAERLIPWVEALNLSRAEVLRDFKGWCYTNDKKGYYTRGVKLFDLRREFEGWQSYQQSLLDKAEREKSRPQNKYGTVSGLPRLEIDPEWLKAMGER